MSPIDSSMRTLYQNERWSRRNVLRFPLPTYQALDQEDVVSILAAGFGGVRCNVLMKLLAARALRQLSYSNAQIMEALALTEDELRTFTSARITVREAEAAELDRELQERFKERPEPGRYVAPDPIVGNESNIRQEARRRVQQREEEAIRAEIRAGRPAV